MRECIMYEANALAYTLDFLWFFVFVVIIHG